jgi:hypothetical protein
MIAVGTRVDTPSGGWLHLIRRTPEQIAFERLLKPGTGRADPHLHKDFVQTWECVSGVGGAIDVEGERRDLNPGDRVHLHLDTPHRDPYNSGERDVVIRGTLEPDTEFLEGYLSAWMHHLREGTVNDQDEMPLLQILAIAAATNGESYRAGIPVALQRASLPLVKRIARLRGYRASYED